MDERRTVVWIASYPKSGNTWVRFLACNLLYGPQQSAAALERLAPDVHELAAPPAAPAARKLMKTHFVRSPHMPLAAHTAAAIYIHRHPADVMLSNFHYAQRRGAGVSGDPEGLTRYLDAYIQGAGDPRWANLGMGNWVENVRSWHAAGAELPVLHLTYEGLLADAADAAGRLCRFLGIERTAGQIAVAVEAASFARLRAIEEADIRSRHISIFFKPYLQGAVDCGLRFMRRGMAGEAAALLTAEQRRRFGAAFGGAMQEFGYTL